jgi:uncharacterized protein (DUF2252 family)
MRRRATLGEMPSSQRSRRSLLAFDDPIPSPQERRLAGKAHRSVTPRAAHGGWEPSPDRVDPIELLVESNRARLADLVPLRYARMSASPFTFLRGSAIVMAHDLAAGPSTALEVRLCGDAHLGNFGVFASPERRLVFDLNDFDEASPGPFEWDVKRLAASLVVAGRENGFDAVATRRAVLEAVAAYRDWMERYAGLTHLEVWYRRIEVSDLLDTMSPSYRKRMSRQVDKAQARNHLRALDRLTEVVDGRRRIVDDPPRVVHIDDRVPDLGARLQQVFGQYRRTLSADRRALFDRYRFVDFARKVVGVGSVGTRCWIALFQGPNGGPLFLQLKEARQSVVSVALGTPPARHFGQRVVEGQRMLQAASDILLGWATDRADGVQYYIRQLWDAKWSPDVSRMSPIAFDAYAGYCGWALARAHARTGDSVGIWGYIGRSERFGEVIAGWAADYADQTDGHPAALVGALDRGVLPTG